MRNYKSFLILAMIFTSFPAYSDNFERLRAQCSTYVSRYNGPTGRKEITFTYTNVNNQNVNRSVDSHLSNVDCITDSSNIALNVELPNETNMTLYLSSDEKGNKIIASTTNCFEKAGESFIEWYKVHGFLLDHDLELQVGQAAKRYCISLTETLGSELLKIFEPNHS